MRLDLILPNSLLATYTSVAIVSNLASILGGALSLARDISVVLSHPISAPAADQLY